MPATARRVSLHDSVIENEAMLVQRGHMVVTPLGDSALVLSFGDTVDDAALARVRSAAAALGSAGFAGVVDIVPAFATVTVHFDLARIGPVDEFERRVAALAGRAAEAFGSVEAARAVEIPVCYGGEFGPDLQWVADRAGLGIDRVIELHSAATYRVHAIGFVPGFAYLGGLPESLHTPRRSTPRVRVAPGSVGIGGAQTGIYPAATPGGWNLLGRTPLGMFDLGRSQPARLRVGDVVAFRPITPEEFAAWV